MIRPGVEGRTSVAFCGGLTGRRVAPADPIRRRSGRDWNDDMGRDGCPRALDVRGVDGCGDGRAVASAVRHWGGGARGRVAGRVARAGALLLRGRADRVWPVSGGGGGGDRLSGDRAVQDASPVGGSQQVRSSRYRSVVATVDGRGADAGRGPLGDVRGREGSGQSARADSDRSDALPAPAVEVAAAPRSSLGPDRVDKAAPRVAGIADVRASEHRAGVHRQPRRVRRADRPQGGAGRAALARCDRPGLLADGLTTARVSRHRHAIGADHHARDRRLHPLSTRGATGLLAGARALARAVRRDRSARVDHQDRLQVRPTDPRRGFMALRPTAPDRQDALRAPGRAARPRPADRPSRPNPPLPRAQADARTPQARQRDLRRVRPRARLLPLGRRDRSVALTDSSSPLGWGGAGPRSPLVRAMLLWAALTRPRPVLDTRQPATEPATWGSQPPHMRLTDVENLARRLPTRATRLTNPQTTAPRGTFNAAHLTDVPPYEERKSRRLDELERQIAAAEGALPLLSGAVDEADAGARRRHGGLRCLCRAGGRARAAEDRGPAERRRGQ